MAEADVLSAIADVKAVVDAIKLKTDILNVVQKVNVSGFSITDVGLQYYNGEYIYNTSNSRYEYIDDSDTYIENDAGTYKIQSAGEPLGRFFSCATLLGTYVVDAGTAQGWETDAIVTNSSTVMAELDNPTVAEVATATPSIVDQRK